MNNSGKQQSFSDREVDDQQQTNENLSPVSTGAGEDSPATVSGDSLSRRNGSDIGLAARLTDLFVGDGDLLVQRNTEDGTVVQWLQALDLQVMGACRADERLKPLLKLNASSVAEDELLSRLSKHFEPSEVGLLARCLCIPLVSVRVGKIYKQGTLFVPTTTRGNLVLSLLPTSDLRISFLADDGYAERLSILRNVSDCSSVIIKGIPTDTSGRSFSITLPSTEHPFYFWCAEKSKLLGNELLEKMKNLLERKPSLAELTGISDSRLQRFVHHLETYLVGSNPTEEVGQTSQSSSPSKPSRTRTCTIQGTLNPRPNSFKLRRRTEGGRISCTETPENLKLPESSTDKGKLPESCTENEKLPECSGSFSLPLVDLPALNSAPPTSSLFSPYYVWCPPVIPSSTTPEFTLPPLSSPYYCWCPPGIPTSNTPEFTLPPLSSLLAASAPNLTEIPPFLPLSMSSSSQQIPMFTPLMCDPIVHIPVIDICSSGQAYLVSGGGPAMSVSIPNSPLVQETELEKSARDTLRLLISGSSQFPSVLANNDGNVNMNVNAIANSIAAMGLVSVSVSVSPGVMMCIEKGEILDTGGTCLNEDGSSEESRE